MPVVRIPSVLRKHTDDQTKVTADGGTVGEVLRGVVAAYPGLEEQLFEGDDLRGFINVYADDEDIRYVEGLDTPVEDDAEIAIMPAVAGGAGRVAGGAEAEPGTRGADRVAGGA